MTSYAVPSNMSSITNDSFLLQVEDKFKSKLPPTVDIMVGFYMVFVCVTSVFVNLLVLVTVYRRERPINPLEIYVVNLAVIDIMPAIISYPIDIMSLFTHHWHLGMTGCRVAAFTVYFFGIASITTVAVMSVMRYIKVCHTSAIKYVNKRCVILSLIPVYVNSIIWTVGPLLGWGSYAPEPFGVTCTLDWRSLPVSYLVAIFTFEYIFPFLIIVYCYGNVVATLCMARRSMTTIKTRMDIYLTKMAMIMAASFLIAWTPYSVVAFMYYFNDYETVPLALAAAAPYTAKSSTIYNPIIYFLAVKRFRQDVSDVFRNMFNSQSTANSTTGHNGLTVISKMSSADDKTKKESEIEEENEEHFDDEQSGETVQLTAYHSNKNGEENLESDS